MSITSSVFRSDLAVGELAVHVVGLSPPELGHLAHAAGCQGGVLAPAPGAAPWPGLAPAPGGGYLLVRHCAGRSWDWRPQLLPPLLLRISHHWHHHHHTAVVAQTKPSSYLISAIIILSYLISTGRRQKHHLSILIDNQIFIQIPILSSLLCDYM